MYSIIISGAKIRLEWSFGCNRSHFGVFCLESLVSSREGEFGEKSDLKGFFSTFGVCKRHFVVLDITNNPK